MSRPPTFRAWFPQTLNQREASPLFEALEPRVLMSAAVLDNGERFRFSDADGDPVRIEMTGPGRLRVDLEGNAGGSADIQRLTLTGGDASTTVKVTLKSGQTNIAEPGMQLGAARFVVDANGGLLTFGQELRPPKVVHGVIGGGWGGGVEGGFEFSSGSGGSPTPFYFNLTLAVSVTLSAASPTYQFTDAIGGLVKLNFSGPGEAQLTLWASGTPAAPTPGRLESIAFTGTTEQTTLDLDAAGAIGAISSITYGEPIGHIHVTSPGHKVFRIDSVNGAAYQNTDNAAHPDIQHTYRIGGGEVSLIDASGDSFKLGNDQGAALVRLTGGQPNHAEIESVVFETGNPHLFIEMLATGGGTSVASLVTNGMGQLDVISPAVGDAFAIGVIDGMANRPKHPRVDVQYLFNDTNDSLTVRNSAGDKVAVRLHRGDGPFSTTMKLSLIGGAADAADFSVIDIDNAGREVYLQMIVQAAPGSDGLVSWRQLDFAEPFGGVLVYDDAMYGGAVDDAPTFTLSGRNNRFVFGDADGDEVTVRLSGPGTAEVYLRDEVYFYSDLGEIIVTGATERTRLSITTRGTTSLYSLTSDGSLGKIDLQGVDIRGEGIFVDGSIGSVKAERLLADLVATQAAARGTTLTFDGIRTAIGGMTDVHVPGELKSLRVTNGVNGLDLEVDSLKSARIGAYLSSSDIKVAGQLKSLSVTKSRQGSGGGSNVDLHAGGIDVLQFAWDLDTSNISSAGDIRSVSVGGMVSNSMLASGMTPASGLDLLGASFAPGNIGSVKVRKDLHNSIVAAGVDPGEDGLFGAMIGLIPLGDGAFTVSDGFVGVDDVLLGGVIGRIDIGGVISGTIEIGEGSMPGVYATQIGRLRVNRHNADSMAELWQSQSITGTALIRTLAEIESRAAVDLICYDCHSGGESGSVTISIGLGGPGGFGESGIISGALAITSGGFVGSVTMSG